MSSCLGIIIYKLFFSLSLKTHRKYQAIKVIYLNNLKQISTKLKGTNLMRLKGKKNPSMILMCVVCVGMLNRNKTIYFNKTFHVKIKKFTQNNIPWTQSTHIICYIPYYKFIGIYVEVYLYIYTLHIYNNSTIKSLESLRDEKKNYNRAQLPKPLNNFCFFVWKIYEKKTSDQKWLSAQNVHIETITFFTYFYKFFLNFKFFMVTLPCM